MRSKAREVVLKYLYAKFFNPDDEELFAVLLNDKDLNNDDKLFATDLKNIIETNKDDYFERIENKVISFAFNRIFNIDKLCICIGICELENFNKTDVPVIVDEAVKLASKFSTEKSPDFVNGILSSFAKEIRKI